MTSRTPGFTLVELPVVSRCKRRAFTLVELMIVIAIIVILIALLLPAVGAVRARMQQSTCANQQRQLVQGMILANENLELDKKVSHTNWTTAILPFLEEDGDKVLYCPSDVETTPQQPGYGMNHVVGRMGDEDAQKIVLLDYNSTEVKVVTGELDNWATSHAPRHLEQVNVAFFDSSTRAMDPAFIDPGKCEYYASYWRPYRLAWIPCPEPGN